MGRLIGFDGNALPDRSRRDLLARLDAFLLARLRAAGALSQRQLVAEAQNALPPRSITDEIANEWWAFAARRGLLEEAHEGNAAYARLSPAGQARFRESTAFMPSVVLVDKLGRNALSIVAVMISTGALVIGAADPAERWNVLGVLYLLAVTGVFGLLLLFAGMTIWSGVTHRYSLVMTCLLLRGAAPGISTAQTATRLVWNGWRERLGISRRRNAVRAKADEETSDEVERRAQRSPQR